MTWPTKIECNEFGICKLDPDAPLELKVRTWQSVLDPGRSVTIHGYHADGARYHNDFGSIKIEHSGSVSDEREHLQSLVDEFNENLAENWRNLVEAAREYVTDHYRHEVKRCTLMLAKVEAGDWT